MQLPLVENTHVMIRAFNGEGCRSNELTEWWRALSATVHKCSFVTARRDGRAWPPVCTLYVDRGLCCVEEMRCLSMPLWRFTKTETVTERARERGRMLRPHYIQCTSVLAASSRVTPVSKVNQTGTIRLIKHASPWRAFSSGSQICFPRAPADVMATDKREWVTPVWAATSLRPVNGRKQPFDPHLSWENTAVMQFGMASQRFVLLRVAVIWCTITN